MLNRSAKVDDRPILDDAGRVSAEYAKEYAESGRISSNMSIFFLCNVKKITCFRLGEDFCG